MIGVSYPLRYQQGNIKLDDKKSEYVKSEIKHFLETLKGERILFQRFGVKIELLFETFLPQVFASSIDIDLQEVIPNDIFYEVLPTIFEKGKLTLEIRFLNSKQVEERIRESVTNIYATEFTTVNR